MKTGLLDVLLLVVNGQTQLMVGSRSAAHANGESCTCARRVTPSPRRRRLERPTERTPRPYKGSGGGMFFASCSSSSSAIVAAGVQRPAWLSGGQSRRTGAASDGFSGAARSFRLRTKPCEIRGSLGARTPAFGAVLPALVLETNPRTGEVCGEVCAGRVLGQRSQDASATGEAARGGW